MSFVQITRGMGVEGEKKERKKERKKGHEEEEGRGKKAKEETQRLLSDEKFH